MLTIKIIPTKEAKPDLLERVFNMVKNAGQIKLDEAILRKNINNSDTILVGYYAARIVALTVIKNPQKSYKRKVFEKADVLSAIDRFDFEIGYCVTLPGYEGRGFCKLLVSYIFKIKPNSNFFATTKSKAMECIFTKFGFEQFGDRYAVEPENSNTEYLKLFVYDKN